MADNLAEENFEEVPEIQAGDVDMGEGVPEEAADEGDPKDADLPFPEGITEEVPPRISFAQYLNSPIVNLVVGSEEEETILTAHKALLVKSPYFASILAAEADNGEVSTPHLAGSTGLLLAVCCVALMDNMC